MTSQSTTNATANVPDLIGMSAAIHPVRTGGQIMTEVSQLLRPEE